MNLLRCCPVLLFVFLSTFVHAQSSSYSPLKTYSTFELLSDYNALADSLDQIHPAIYRYTTKRLMRNFEDSLRKSITHPMTEQQFLTLIQLLESKIKDGHTMILPSDDAIGYLHHSAHLFPFAVGIWEGKLYITENNSADRTIPKGENILSINGVPAATLLEELLIRRPVDGTNLQFPLWQLDHFFASSYYFNYGEPSSFTLVLRHAGHKAYTREVAALTRDSVNFYRQTPAQTHKGIFLETKEDIPILTIPSFDSALLRENYDQNFQTVIDSIFLHIHNNKNNQLIIDLRDNQGGDFETGRHLLSWLSLEPTQYLTGGGEARWIKPNALHYTGKLIILVNGGSFSNTVIVSSTLERDQRAIFVGEETGGNKHLISGDPKELVLPQTKISVYISTTDFHILENFNDGRGLKPGYTVVPTLEDLQTGRDPVMEKAIQLAKSK